MVDLSLALGIAHAQILDGVRRRGGNISVDFSKKSTTKNNTMNCTKSPHFPSREKTDQLSTKNENVCNLQAKVEEPRVAALTCPAPDVVPGVGGDALDDPGLEEEVPLLLELVGPGYRAPHRDRVLS